MKNKIIMTALCVQLIGCASLQYPDWQYVRIERELPNNTCVYKLQDVCNTKHENCLTELKKRASSQGANTVLIAEEKDQDGYARSSFTGNAKGGNFTTMIVEYYDCTGVKNIKPKRK